ncbi:2'-5' RNA ligase family protein [Arcticibacterium luteifluviistationis]|uniref:2'-5' RNA ligase n=1 Tax=Arcticibacterium luteifluviistationis TaxID=1784714 RepID=A0A2Z4GG03_9BACT|nr:2'-5' RNA ligase family protein [Arcticibacterium luteifluviistationis]AWV99975.1 hypothetical protein DJ013_18105 [Arcticibacterium luteifluviistationis]
MENMFASEIHFVLNVISPPTTIIEQVSAIKQDFFNRYGDYESYHSTAHITINSYPIDSNRIIPFHNKLKEFIHNYPTLDIKLNGFGFWDSSKTIFLKVKPNHILDNFKEELNIWRRLNHLKSNYEYSKVSHLTIAKSLNSSIYQDAKSYYKDKNFTGEFTSTHILSLLKTTHTNPYSPHSSFLFKE